MANYAPQILCVIFVTACFEPSSSDEESETELSSTDASSGSGNPTTTTTSEGSTTDPGTTDTDTAGGTVDSTSTEGSGGSTSVVTTAAVDTGTATESTGEPQEPRNVAFVTSTSHTGALGGRDGADEICRNAAAAAGLEGEFVAFIGTNEAENPRDRLASARGWVRTDGRPVLDLPTDPLLYPLRISELGEDVGGDVEVWTGDRRIPLPLIPLATCTDWTSSSAAVEGIAGYADAVAADFHDATRDPCSFARRLYCFQTDHETPTELPTMPGRVAFVGQTSWDGFGGIEVADDICQTQADMVGLSGQFLAALSGTSASARSRFDLDGERWVRPDGLAIAPTAAAFFDEAFWDIPPHMFADGEVPDTAQVAWTGPEWDTTGTSNQTCNNWGGFSSALAGRTSRTDKSAAIGSVTVDDCDDSGNDLYCLER